jgi:hypothetical protein
LHRYKCLVVSGCSFTPKKGWPYWLGKKLYDIEVKNYACISSGNGRISRSLIYGVNEALKTYKPKEILVGVMWSSASRFEVFKEQVDMSMIHNHSDGVNPTNFVEGADKNWILIHSGWDDVYSKNYYGYFYDDVGNYISTIEHILRTQWFLKGLSIDYFMTEFSTGVLPKNKNIENPNIKYLYDMIDHSKFLPVTNCLEWVEASGVPNTAEEMAKPFTMRHPSDNQHRAFAVTVAYDFVAKNYFKGN